MRTAPATAIRMPTQTGRETCRPAARASSAAHTGWVTTRAVEDATEVSVTLGTQVAKCAARNTPASRASPQPRRSSARISDRRATSAAGSSTPPAIRLRQAAMARAGAAVAAISGPAVDAASTATAIRAASRGGGTVTASVPGPTPVPATGTIVAACSRSPRRW